jgi:aspartate-semialdehyde dehydrogenase
MLATLEARDFPSSKIIALASERSVGIALPFRGGELTVQELKEDSFQGVDIALFSAGGGTSERFAPYAVRSGCVVIDNSSAWRMDERCPLIVPEVNAHALGKHKGIIANPNCSTIQMVVVLSPLHKAATIRRVVVSTYQAVSGTGQKAVTELDNQVRQIFNMAEPEVKIYPHRIAFNCLPHIDVFLENGYTKEEMKMVRETVKIMEDDTIRITATTVRVPVFYGHSESVNVEFERPLSADDARSRLREAKGVVVLDNPAEKIYPMPITVAGEDAVFVGRIRADESQANTLNMWVVADNVRKGAALNAVQIAEELVRENLVRVPNRAAFLK